MLINDKVTVTTPRGTVIVRSLTKQENRLTQNYYAKVVHSVTDERTPEGERFRTTSSMGMERVGKPPDQKPSALLLRDLLQSGHEFSVEQAEPIEWRCCQYCGVPIRGDDTQGEWLCEMVYEHGAEPWDRCECSWCLCRRAYRKPGRPASTCGYKECEKELRRSRNKRYRAGLRRKLNHKDREINFGFFDGSDLPSLRSA